MNFGYYIVSKHIFFIHKSMDAFVGFGESRIYITYIKYAISLIIYNL